MVRYYKRRRFYRRRRYARRISRYSRRIGKRSYRRGRRTYRRSTKRSRLNRYLAVRGAFKHAGVDIAFQPTSDDQWLQFDPVFHFTEFLGFPNSLYADYQKYRIKNVTYKFIPNKHAMTALATVAAAPGYLNPPNIECYVVDVGDKQTFAPQSVLQNILEQPGVRRKNALRPFSVSWIPKVQQIRQFSIAGNIYSTVRRPWLPTSGNAMDEEHFGKYFYFRQPYDPLAAVAGNPFLHYQIEVIATIEFRDARY